MIDGIEIIKIAGQHPTFPQSTDSISITKKLALQNIQQAA